MHFFFLSDFFFSPVQFCVCSTAARCVCVNTMRWCYNPLASRYPLFVYCVWTLQRVCLYVSGSIFDVGCVCCAFYLTKSDCLNINKEDIKWKAGKSGATHNKRVRIKWIFTVFFFFFLLQTRQKPFVYFYIFYSHHFQLPAVNSFSQFKCQDEKNNIH